MTRSNWLSLLACCVCVMVSLVACGDDDSSGGPDGGAAAPPSKALDNLTGAELKALCGQLLATVRGASTLQTLCTQTALGEATSASECNTAQKRCLDGDEAEAEVDYYSQARCADFSGAAAGDEPSFGCATKVSEVTECYDSAATWLKGLRCSDAGDVEDPPSCLEELDEGKCGFALSKLLEGGSSGSDAGPSSDFMCSGDGMSYPYDFGEDGCNQCATQNCCDSFVECQGDDSCACYWECSEDECFTPCGLATYPPAFVDHATCLTDKCAAVCGLED